MPKDTMPYSNRKAKKDVTDDSDYWLAKLNRWLCHPLEIGALRQDSVYTEKSWVWY